MIGILKGHQRAIGINQCLACFRKSTVNLLLKEFETNRCKVLIHPAFKQSDLCFHELFNCKFSLLGTNKFLRLFSQLLFQLLDPLIGSIVDS
ncbi:hypothetical protein SDC9_199729 [bioreactor metagenome]|uniref:Uncharacterized protein n=1 Tax=bioreactor metagenome TaxID=1076179 RepID=A0A645IL82_9ZZZZ